MAGEPNKSEQSVLLLNFNDKKSATSASRKSSLLSPTKNPPAKANGLQKSKAMKTKIFGDDAPASSEVKTFLSGH